MAARHAGGRPRELALTPLGKIIEAEIERRHLHADIVAERAGVSLPTLQRIKTGRIASPRISTLFALAEAIGCNPNRLTAAFIRRPKKKIG